ncbi:ABC-2 transporter permease [Halobacillus sp. K22]|uniref:ABC-2 transporter permease n=1 Tax=Halobacillus sp. K22 TaxID=3457431 RepID=UPI003FCC765F
MKGLLLNQYYTVEKTIINYIPLALLLTTILIFFDNSKVQRLAAFLPIILMASSSLEVLKREAKSGWNQYVLTLPVKRQNVVQSHYIFFILLTITGLLIACIGYALALFIGGQPPGNAYGHSLMSIIGITFTMGFTAYPLTYALGTEKAELVAGISAGAGLGLYFLSASLFEFLIMPIQAFQGFNSDLLFSLSFMVITLLLFVLSYMISIQIYKRKEF